MQTHETESSGLNPANDPKIALVTGANKGVGYQIAKALAEHGYVYI